MAGALKFWKGCNAPRIYYSSNYHSFNNNSNTNRAGFDEVTISRTYYGSLSEVSECKILGIEIRNPRQKIGISEEKEVGSIRTAKRLDRV